MPEMRIIRLSDQPAIRFAAAELRRYLHAATGHRAQVLSRKRFREAAATIWLGDGSSLPTDPLCADPAHDAFSIHVRDDTGTIAGANPRSVLIGVYRYLEELGYRWLRPGSEGEVVPSLTAPLPTVDLCERASYDHRGVCIEGAVSYENVRDMVDWLPKVGCNAYFIQFREAYNFFQRWYEHVGNPHLPRRPYTVDRAADMTARLRREIKRRGLDLHMVGHGWTCEPFGIPGPGWFQHEGDIPEEARPFLAEIDGKRDLWGGVALNTNLCYGNPETRRIVVESIVEYARVNADVDILHFWLADGTNNHCECSLCVNHRPADLYVRMLNELDAALTEAGVDTRIVFLVYVDLLWPPVVERITHPERFILMFAPITRSYSSAFAGGAQNGHELPPYVRNKLEFPRDPGLNIAFLHSWQRDFGGDGFDFDYHLMWDHYLDPGQMASARVLHEDVQRLQDIGLNGLISCQVQRVFFPSALTMTVMGRALWNRELSFDQIISTHLEAEYGDGWERVKAFLARISELFDPPSLRGERDEAAQAQVAVRLRDLPREVAAIHELVCTGMGHPQPAIGRSWQHLHRFLELCLLLGEAFEARYTGSADAEEKAWAVFECARGHERALQPVMDLFEFQNTLGPRLGLSREQLETR